MKAIEQHINKQIQEPRIKNQDRRYISYGRTTELKEEFELRGLLIKDEKQEFCNNCVSAIQFNSLPTQLHSRFLGHPERSRREQFEIYTFQRKGVDYIRICLN